MCGTTRRFLHLHKVNGLTLAISAASCSVSKSFSYSNLIDLHKYELMCHNCHRWFGRECLKIQIAPYRAKVQDPEGSPTFCSKDCTNGVQFEEVSEDKDEEEEAIFAEFDTGFLNLKDEDKKLLSFLRVGDRLKLRNC